MERTFASSSFEVLENVLTWALFYVFNLTNAGGWLQYLGIYSALIPVFYNIAGYLYDLIFLGFCITVDLLSISPAFTKDICQRTDVYKIFICYWQLITRKMTGFVLSDLVL